MGPYGMSPVRKKPELEPGATPKVALKETCRLGVAGDVPLWRYHVRRLKAGGCGADVITTAEEAIGDAVSAYDGAFTSRIRLTLVIDTDGKPKVSVERRLSSLDVIDGVKAVPVYVEELPVLPEGAAKPLDRAYWDDAHRQAKAAGADQALITRSGGHIIDGSTATLFCRLGHVIATPPSPPAIAGVARRWIMDTCGSLGYACLAAPISVDDLAVADEVFFCNAFGGLREMSGRGGEAYVAISEALRDLWERGTDD